MLQNPSGPANIFSVAFPESKIPSWFTKRSLEPLISIEVNPNGYKSNWKGIALCVCFRLDPSNTFSCQMVVLWVFYVHLGPAHMHQEAQRIKPILHVKRRICPPK